MHLKVGNIMKIDVEVLFATPFEWAMARLGSVHLLIETVACKCRDFIAHFVVGKPRLCPLLLGVETNRSQVCLTV